MKQKQAQKTHLHRFGNSAAESSFGRLGKNAGRMSMRGLLWEGCGLGIK
jgi:hypothetical protein